MQIMTTVITNRWGRAIGIGIVLSTLIMVSMVCTAAIVPANAATEHGNAVTSKALPTVLSSTSVSIRAPDELEELIEILRYLLILLGGTPPEGGTAQDVNEALPTISNLFTTSGFPALTEPERLDAVEALDDLEELLTGTLPSGVDQTIVSAFLPVLDDMQEALE